MFLLFFGRLLMCSDPKMSRNLHCTCWNSDPMPFLFLILFGSVCSSFFFLAIKFWSYTHFLPGSPCTAPNWLFLSAKASLCFDGVEGGVLLKYFHLQFTIISPFLLVSIFSLPENSFPAVIVSFLSMWAKYLMWTTSREKALFYLMVLDVEIHGPLAPLLWAWGEAEHHSRRVRWGKLFSFS